jgi:hypothetical protein
MFYVDFKNYKLTFVKNAQKSYLDNLVIFAILHENDWLFWNNFLIMNIYTMEVHISEIWRVAFDTHYVHVVNPEIHDLSNKGQLSKSFLNSLNF